MRVACSESIDRRYSQEYSQEIEGICVSCSRCGASQFSFGTHQASTDRCLALLNDNCPRDENNYYEIGSGGARNSTKTDVTPLHSFYDFEPFDDIPGRDRHVIATAVQDWGGRPSELTLWLPEWLAEEKNLDPEDRAIKFSRVFVTTAPTKRGLSLRSPLKNGSRRALLMRSGAGRRSASHPPAAIARGREHERVLRDAWLRERSS